MSNTVEKAAALALSSLKSGKIGIRINDRKPVRIEIYGETISVDIPGEHAFGEGFEGFRYRLTEIRLIRKVAEILNKSSKKLDLLIEGRKLLSMGKGVNSILGNEKFFFSNLMRFFRK